MSPKVNVSEQHPALKVLNLTATQAALLDPGHKTYSVRHVVDEAERGDDVVSNEAWPEIVPGAAGRRGLADTLQVLHRVIKPAGGQGRERRRVGFELQTAAERAAQYRRSRANRMINRWLGFICVLLSSAIVYQLGAQIANAYEADLAWREILQPMKRLEVSQEAFREVAGSYAGASFALERHVSSALLETTRITRVERPGHGDGYMIELCRTDLCVLRDIDGVRRVDAWGRSLTPPAVGR